MARKPLGQDSGQKQPHNPPSPEVEATQKDGHYDDEPRPLTEEEKAGGYDAILRSYINMRELCLKEKWLRETAEANLNEALRRLAVRKK